MPPSLVGHGHEPSGFRDHNDQATSTSQLIEWFLGEQVRGTTTRIRGANLGILTRDLKAESKGTWETRPNSCAPGLTTFIPTPDHDIWFAVDEQGQLLRYGGDAWSTVSGTSSLAPIGYLLAMSGSAPHLELLLTLQKDNRHELTVLTIVDGEVTDHQPPTLARLGDRDSALRSYDSGRCVDAVLNCLHLTETDQGLALMLEPELFRYREELDMLNPDAVRDVRYANTEGTRIAVLTKDACSPATAATPSPDPEALE